jgi:uncharacterized protein YxeA
MNLKHVLIILLVILLASSIAWASSSFYYGKSYVYFNIPYVITFNVTLPNNEEYNASESGNPTADEGFNSTGNEKNVTVYVVGTTYTQNSTVIGHETNVSNYIVKNTGNANANITMCLNESLPENTVLFGTKSADPYDNPSIIPNCSYSAWIANSSLAVGNTTEFWIWTNFTSFQTGTARELYINSTQSS